MSMTITIYTSVAMLNMFAYAGIVTVRSIIILILIRTRVLSNIIVVVSGIDDVARSPA